MDTPYLVYFRCHPLNDLGQLPGIAGSGGIEANVAADEFLRNRLCRVSTHVGRWSERLVVHSAETQKGSGGVGACHCRHCGSSPTLYC